MTLTYLLAYLLSTLVGGVVVGGVVKLMWATTGRKREWFRPMDIWVGVTERAIATTLFIWAPTQLAFFIGGWVAAKLAAGWGKRTDDDAAVGHFRALVGNAVSFAIALAAGVLAHPASLDILYSPPK